MTDTVLLDDVGPVPDEVWSKPRTMEMVLADLVNVQAITSPRPEIDSIWKDKTGRRVRICKIIESQTIDIDGHWWADLFVLPPYAYRQRRRTQADRSAFTSGFYKLESL